MLASIKPDCTGVRGSQALDRLMSFPDVNTVLDVGSGAGIHAAFLRGAGKDVTTLDIAPPADIVADFMDMEVRLESFDAIWASHVLEHQPNVGAFLRKCRQQLRRGGVLAVTVPPLKHDVVGGHLALFNAGTLIYNLILAGFDCSDARVGTYASGPGYPVYNISVLVRKPLAPLELPPLRMDKGDIEALAEFFPMPVTHGFDGQIPDIRWN